MRLMTAQQVTARLAVLAAVGVGAMLGGCARRSPMPRANERAVVAPDSFRVAFETSRGQFDVVAHRA